LIPHFKENEERDLTSHFMMHKFKTLWCPYGEPHTWETCVYAHTYRDWRRLPSLGYCSRPCPAWAHSLTQSSDLAYTERCRLGMACPCAHGAKEQLYHPDFYKTSPCDNPACSKSVELCAFTHGSSDLRMKPSNIASQRRSPIIGAEEFLEENQSTYRDPPKYLSLEDSSQFANNAHATKFQDSEIATIETIGCCICEPCHLSDVLSTRPMQTYDAVHPTCLSCSPQPCQSQFEMPCSSCYYAPVVVLQPIQIIFAPPCVSTNGWGENYYGVVVADNSVVSYG
jgi:hypothetical protein